VECRFLLACKYGGRQERLCQQAGRHTTVGDVAGGRLRHRVGASTSGAGVQAHRAAAHGHDWPMRMAKQGHLFLQDGACYRLILLNNSSGALRRVFSGVLNPFPNGRSPLLDCSERSKFLSRAMLFLSGTSIAQVSSFRSAGFQVRFTRNRFLEEDRKMVLRQPLTPPASPVLSRTCGVLGLRLRPTLR